MSTSLFIILLFFYLCIFISSNTSLDVTQAVDVDVSDQTVSMTLNKMNFQIVISRVLEYDGNLNVVKVKLLSFQKDNYKVLTYI